ncbi:30S ribosomal protein S21 [Candidatus Uhrbacteria bacterium]|nr:30S ribosomal protein S21 [Candidatus Uhrbacteria bacterium]
MPEVRRKQKESFEALLRRFNRQIQQSGRILQVKKIRFYSRKKSAAAKQTTALRRRMIEEKKEYLKKIGKLKDRFPGTKALMKL